MTGSWEEFKHNHRSPAEAGPYTKKLRRSRVQHLGPLAQVVVSQPGKTWENMRERKALMLYEVCRIPEMPLLKAFMTELL
jgi:hypothetical protein